MSNIKKAYGICIQTCELKDHNLNKREQLRQGDLIRIFEKNAGDFDNDKCDKFIVKLYDFDENKFINVVYECAKQSIDYVTESLWLYMIGTTENHIRMLIYNERDLVLRLKCDTEITINSYGNDSNANIKGVIKLIGPIMDKGFGNFVGLKLKSPPQNRDTLITLYKMHFDTSTNLLLFRIELLLDAIKIAEQNDSDQNGNNKFRSKLPSLVPLEQNVQPWLLNKKVEIPVQPKYINPYVSPVFDRNLNTDVSEPTQDNKFIFNTNSIKTPNELNSSLSTILKYGQNSTTTPLVTNETVEISNLKQLHTNYMNQSVSPIMTNNSNTQVPYGLQVDTRKSDTNLITTANYSSNNNTTLFNTRPYSITPPQITLFDHLCDSNTLPSGNNWPGMLKSKQDSEFQPISYTENFIQKPYEVNRTSNLSEAVSKTTIQWDSKHQKRTDNPNGCIIGDDVTSSLRKRNDFAMENSNMYQQLVDLPVNTAGGVVPKNNEPANIQRNKRTKNNNIPGDIELNNKHISQANRSQRSKQTRPCQICNASFNRESLVLKCMHCICSKCFVSKTPNLNKTGIKCLYRRGQKSECKYKLSNFEIKQLCQDNNRPTTPQSDDSDDKEEIFECKTEKCEGKWFIPKSTSMNLFKCPICQISNCIHCKVIHENMSCTEYKNSLKIQVQPGMLQNLTEKLNNFVVSFIPGMGRVAEPQLIPEGACGPDGNETLMKCYSKKCKAQWFVLNNENNTLFKCPICELYNCFKCQVIHQNQTCDEYRETKRKKYIPNFIKHKSPDTNRAPNINQKAITDGKPAINHFTKRKWTCKHCTYENFSFGYVCEICQKLSN